MLRHKFSSNSSSVSELLERVKYIVNKSFDYVAVRGEVSNFSKSSQGHYYLSLSDNKSLINGIIFRGDAFRMRDVQGIENGDQVEVVAELNLYEKRGQVQLVIKKLAKLGEGDIKAQFDELKKKLFHEGLFDESKKKKIPRYPSNIAVVSAEKSAALQDFINIHNRRSFSCNVVIFPAVVQGEKASESVTNSLDKIQRYQKEKQLEFDCVVICRGGGSFEDLNCFNNEKLARAVSMYETPVISAIGHQTDYTILDFISDLRAETPSAAAELLSEHEFQLTLKLDQLKLKLENKMTRFSIDLQKRFNAIKPVNLLSLIGRKVKIYQDTLNDIIIFNRPETTLGIYNFRQRLDECNFRLKSVLTKDIQYKKNKVQSNYNLLNALDPYKVMDRGYSIIKNESGDVLSSKEKMIPKSKIKIIQNDGETYAKIL